MSRERPTRRTAMREPPERSASVMATSGPGATNLVTGIATAYMDSVPVVAITANVTVGLLGRDSFQEVDITGVTMPITKHNFIVKDVAELADTIRQRLFHRSGGPSRPGPGGYHARTRPQM